MPYAIDDDDSHNGHEPERLGGTDTAQPGVDGLAMLTDTLAAHRQMLLGARETHADLDLHRALEAHAGLGAILTRWDDYTAAEQRRIIATVEYLVNDEDATPDLRSSDGFADDLAELHQLQDFLGYV